MRYILFGDSIAFGMNDLLKKGWAGRLKKHIHKNKKGELKGKLFVNYAVSGYTSNDILKILEKKAKKRINKHPRDKFTIIIAVGANDSKHHKFNPKKDIQKKEFEKNILKIIEISKRLAKKVIVIGLIPVYEKKINSLNRICCFSNSNIIIYNNILKNCSKKESVRFIEIYNYFIKKDINKLLSDGLHPNRKGHQLIFEHLINSKIV